MEFFGPGLSNISLADRATVANMAPEYGATVGFFPVDNETLNFLRNTGREEEQIALVEAYYKAQGMFRSNETPDPVFSDVVELDLSSIVPSLAGPKRPQDRVELTSMKEAFNDILRTPIDKGGYGLSDEKIDEVVDVKHKDGQLSKMSTGAVVIAAITSCTNTSNPSVMLGAGLVAKKSGRARTCEACLCKKLADTRFPRRNRVPEKKPDCWNRLKHWASMLQATAAQLVSVTPVHCRTK